MCARLYLGKPSLFFISMDLASMSYTEPASSIPEVLYLWKSHLRNCSGPSMEPTIQNSDIVFSENLSRHFYCIRKGDIVIVKSPNDPKSNICKRVIGLEGDKVCTSNPSDFLKSHSYNKKNEHVAKVLCCEVMIQKE
ncbi:hypothetical protein IHE44_0006670 [Lamprotornis superbus]|uniref:Mitochondrial inner membrane protease subunit n=1 Tax=Lamprotornis superbus TaxID=245042 RepID=A0A835TWM0_9PASS|nr:hypothetical protein IHE44_0006670 [Lamprotornis superbus]